MVKSGRGRNSLNSLLLVLSCGLAACGGGGGGGGSGSSSGGGSPPPPPPVNRGFTTTVNSISRSATVAGDEALDASFQVTVTDPTAGPYGVRATYTENAISGAHYTTMSTTTIEISLGFRSPETLSPGTYTDTIRIGLCEDPACSAFKGTTFDLPVTFTVTTGTLPTVTVASSSVEISRLPWDLLTPPPALVAVTPSTRTRYFLAVTTTATSDGISSATYKQDTGDAGRVEIAFKPPTQLAPGVHTDTVKLSVCLDVACKYPVVTSPSTITVTYNVSNTVPGADGYTIRKSTLPTADIAWSAVHDAFYASVPTQSPDYPGKLVLLDPSTDTVSSSVATGFEPHVLALSGDESMIYVSDRAGDGIRRFTTAPLAADILISLGTHSFPPGTAKQFADDMRVAPGQPRVLAVRRAIDASGYGVGIVVYDDAVMRPEVALIGTFSDWGRIAWDPDGTRLYADRAVMNVGLTGPVFASNLPGLSGRLTFVNGLLYADEGQVVELAKPDSYVWFASQGRLRAGAIDVAANRAYFASQAFANDSPLIEVFNLQTRAAIGFVWMPPFAANVRPTRLLRFGTNGLAMVNSANELYLLQGPFVH